MTNAELIKVLRYCGNFEDRDGCDEECPYFNDKDCPKRIMCDAAAALEAADKRIAELEKQIPKEGKWIEHRTWGFSYASPLITNYHCSICDHEESHNKYHYCPNCGAKMTKGKQE